MRYEKIENVLGQKINSETITQILNSLDFKINGISKEGINIIAPNYRHDVSREIDVIENTSSVWI